jgi:hypothetical protein
MGLGEMVAVSVCCGGLPTGGELSKVVIVTPPAARLPVVLCKAASLSSIALAHTA